MTHSAQHITSTAASIFKLTKTLTLENLREPTALLWTAIAPSVMFIFATQNNRALPPLEENFLASAAWFYSYISASVAFFWIQLLLNRKKGKWVSPILYLSTERNQALPRLTHPKLFITQLRLLLAFLHRRQTLVRSLFGQRVLLPYSMFLYQLSYIYLHWPGDHCTAD